MSRHLQPQDVPYGVFYCRVCACERACDVALGANAMDPECALECLTCNERIGEEVDEVQRYPLPPDTVTRHTLTPEQRAAGRAKARSMALGVWDREHPLTTPAPAAAPPPGFRERQAAEIERMRGRR